MAVMNEKKLIEDLCKYYNYNIVEYKLNNNKDSIWGVKNLDKEKYLVFLNVNEFNKLQNEHIENNSITKVLLINPDSDYKQYINCSNIIILDGSSLKVLFYTIGNEYEVNEIEQLSKGKYEVNNKVRYTPYITYSLIFINVIIFIFTAFLSGSIFNSDIRVLVYLGAKVNELIVRGQYYRLFTCMFLHGGLMHIGFNMYALYSLGPLIERVYGRNRFLLIYIFSGLIASILSYIMSPSISVGASGAIFGLIGAALIFGIKMKNRIGKGFLSNIISVIFINIFIGISLPNIDNYGHIGGLIGGIVISWLLYKKKRG